ncbi:hypothetical protein [Vagococcus elongatus]|nr:hypothetical protein [Vagococcus elongatus]
MIGIGGDTKEMLTNGKKRAIPGFSVKSSLLILLAGLVGGIIFPYFFYELHWDTRIAVMLFLPALISAAIAYGQCCIETDAGICKRFWIILSFSFFILEVLSYFWLYKGLIF